MIKKLSVLGLGYIGLPTASMFATHGLKVVGIDINQFVINTLRNGDIHIEEPGLKAVVQTAISSGNLSLSETVEFSDAFIISVPTPINPDKTAYMDYVISAAESIVPCLQEGNLVVLESTSPPRTTVDLVQPILEKSGLKAGRDFLLAYSPERVIPGQILRELVENARVIGGINQASAQAGYDLYSAFVKGEIILTDATTAEMVKLMENTYRDINIAIANEFSRLADRFKINVWEAIEIANRHPRVKILNPGPGVGGHCISVDPWFFIEAASDLACLIRQARNVNDQQPAYVVSRIEKELGALKGKKVAILGLTYKANVDDMRESPAIEVFHLLKNAGAIVRAYDPYAKVPLAELCDAQVFSIEEVLAGAEAVIFLVDHQEFLRFIPGNLSKIINPCLILDTRNALSKEAWEAAGYKYLVLGDGQ